MRAVPFLLLFALPLAVQAATYKWKDAAGRLQFTQLPPAAGVPFEILGAAAAPQPAPNQESLNQALQQNLREAPARQQAAEQSAAVQSARQQNCINALERVAYLDAHTPRRLAVTDDKGNVARMSQEEFERQRAAEQERIKQNCD